MHGAVSSETALAMARGVRLKSGADFGLASTGIAGPGGGTPEKPVGLVYFGLDDGARSFTRRHIFGGNREWNKERAALTALNILRTVLETGT
jgi:PncC family amidohydrolase